MTSFNRSPPKFSVVMPTKNGGELFRRAIRQLQAQNLWHQSELIVVDSGSTDGTVDVARAAGAKVYEIQPEEFNHGATRDFGIALASGEFVILLVQDAISCDNDLFGSILKPFEDREVAGVYARQIPQADADLLTQRNLNNWLTGRVNAEVRKIESIEWYESLPPIKKYFFCNFDNVCSAIRKSVWRSNKFGSINFGEDIDWAERVLKAGYKIAYQPSAAVIHSHDRPLSYEYKRTYVCHRKLYRQFGLHLVPDLRGAFRSWLYSIGQDIKYVHNLDAPYQQKMELWVKIPILNFLCAFAQYRAARDEAIGTVRQIHGV